MIYLDSAALVKVVVAEPESARLARWLDTRPIEPLCSSALAEVELSRAVGRKVPAALARVALVLADLFLAEIDEEVRMHAANLSPPTLRSLDAIHLATALQFGAELNAFVTYDKRLLDAARVVGLPAECP